MKGRIWWPAASFDFRTNLLYKQLGPQEIHLTEAVPNLPLLSWLFPLNWL